MEGVIEDMARYRPSPQSMRMVEKILEQGDVRYTDHWSKVRVAGFLTHGAIAITSSIIEGPQMEEIPVHKGPQQNLKRIAAWLLRKRGYTVKGCEVWVTGGRADIVGSDKEESVWVECGSCGISKPIDYLEQPQTLMWVLTQQENSIVLHEFRRGKNWEQYIAFHRGVDATKMDDAQKEYDRIMEDMV